MDGETTMQTMATDEKLVARTLAGDRGAFRLLAERHHQWVYRLCRSILHHSEDAEDATQEVFLRAYQALHQYGGRGAFGAWLRRLAVNHCLNCVRSASARHSAAERPLDLYAETLGGGSRNDPEERVLRLERRQRIHARLAELPDVQRVALSLRLVEELSYDEIADMMGAPINSVRSWLHRGRARLRETLEEVEC